MCAKNKNTFVVPCDFLKKDPEKALEALKGLGHIGAMVGLFFILVDVVGKVEL